MHTQAHTCTHTHIPRAQRVRASSESTSFVSVRNLQQSARQHNYYNYILCSAYYKNSEKSAHQHKYYRVQGIYCIARMMVKIIDVLQRILYRTYQILHSTHQILAISYMSDTTQQSLDSCYIVHIRCYIAVIGFLYCMVLSQRTSTTTKLNYTLILYTTHGIVYATCSTCSALAQLPS